MEWFWTLCENVFTVMSYIGVYLNSTLRAVFTEGGTLGTFVNPISGETFTVYGMNFLSDVPILGNVVDFASNILYNIIEIMFPFATSFPMWLTLTLMGACIIVPIVIWNQIVG